MSSEVAIRVEGLSKQYRIGRAQRYKALRDTITDTLASPLRIVRSAIRATESAESPAGDLFWALRDVSFDVRRGEVVGIIGRNGAGKSTLLKILSRITEPTEGRAFIQGRVASLLEVGTGFHPELTGRENIYLNGAILGMRRDELTSKFDEIVAFAEVERFVDTVVKHYSSGMQMRLAFAVAAHLDPEILIVDEVLAVGDAQFQKKCLGKMDQVAKEGRTILVVSHNIAVVKALCDSAVLLVDGRVEMSGPVEAVISRYLTPSGTAGGEVKFAGSPGRPALFGFLGLSSAGKNKGTDFDLHEEIQVCLELEVRQLVPDLDVSVRVNSALGIPVFTTNRSDSCADPLPPGRYRLSFDIPRQFLAPGDYTLSIGAHRPGVAMYHLAEDCLRFTVHDTGYSLSRYDSAITGLVLLSLPWGQRSQN